MFYRTLNIVHFISCTWFPANYYIRILVSQHPSMRSTVVTPLLPMYIPLHSPLAIPRCPCRLHLPTLCNDHIHHWPIQDRSAIFNLADNIHTFLRYDFSKYNMFPIKKGGRATSNEELGTVRIFPRVRHTEQPRFIMFQSIILVREVSRPVDTCPAGAVTVQKISALNHEVFDLYI